MLCCMSVFGLILEFLRGAWVVKVEWRDCQLHPEHLDGVN